ncbi:MAG TPA: hypothetical protein VFW33_00420, partial [Gemmataceae bacterium]|nr:hypothetical protein [Gemmataceae bacterium]
ASGLVLSAAAPPSAAQVAADRVFAAQPVVLSVFGGVPVAAPPVTSAVIPAATPARPIPMDVRHPDLISDRGTAVLPVLVQTRRVDNPSYDLAPAPTSGIAAAAGAAIVQDGSSPTEPVPDSGGGVLRPDMPAAGGTDVLVGGDGDDLLLGGEGRNLLVGGYAAGDSAGGECGAPDGTPLSGPDDAFLSQ